MQSRVPKSAITAILLGALLILGLNSLSLIPYYRPFWGLDFHNVFVFQTCQEAASIGVYKTSGAMCGDVSGRAFIYPPAMFHAFFWVKWFTFENARFIWNAAMIVGMATIGGVWLWLDRRTHHGWRTVVLVVFWLLLLVQFPSIFALERGNNDVIVVVLWTAATVFFISRRPAISGGFAGLAAVLKIYPVVPIAVVLVGMFQITTWRRFFRFTLGAMLAILVGVLLWWPETFEYLTQVLPAFTDQSSPLSITNHVLRALPLNPYAVASLGVVLLLSWLVAAWSGMDREPLLIFAGALAISTYFSSTSWDYNLITAYPLLLLVAARAVAKDGALSWKLASIASVATLVAGRGAFTPTIQLLGQLAVLIWIAWLIVRTGLSARIPSDRTGHGAPIVTRSDKGL